MFFSCFFLFHYFSRRRALLVFQPASEETPSTTLCCCCCQWEAPCLSSALSLLSFSCCRRDLTEGGGREKSQKSIYYIIITRPALVFCLVVCNLIDRLVFFSFLFLLSFDEFQLLCCVAPGAIFVVETYGGRGRTRGAIRPMHRVSLFSLFQSSASFFKERRRKI